jgi:hypothetical protein
MALGRRELMERLARVLFEMKPLDADLDALGRGHVDDHLAFAHDRMFKLRDLITLGQIGIEIVLAVEHRTQIDLRLEAEPGSDRLRHAFLVYDGQHARHGRVDQRNMVVGFAAVFGARA